MLNSLYLGCKLIGRLQKNAGIRFRGYDIANKLEINIDSLRSFNIK